MSVSMVLGAQWGDEGKGKLIDYLVNHEKVDVTARCQGGNNAGHTVKANGKSYDFHILPSGVINARCLNVIGNGVVMNLDSFFKEIVSNGIDKDFPGWEKRIFVSNRSHIVLNIHQQADGQHEGLLGTASKIGTTNKGIGPTYSSKCFRNGVRMCELMGDFSIFTERYNKLVDHYVRYFPNITVNRNEELEKLKAHAAKLREIDCVVDTAFKLHKLLNEGKNILVEGANGVLLDLDFGTYPYVTSSNASVGGAYTGLGLPASAITRVVGVAKAYQTRVGEGPFPTEQLNEIGDRLQSVGHEFGVTTGRKRRCGWLDLFLLRAAHVSNGFTDIAFTKLDILDVFDEVKVAVAYKLDGKKLESPPAAFADWERIEVEYKTFPGWKAKICDTRSYEQLPAACREYIEFIETFVGVKIKYIGVGQTRDALIVR